MTKYEKAIRKSLPQGYTYSKAGSGHIRILDRDRTTVSVISSTPGMKVEHVLDNMRKDIRRPHRRQRFAGGAA